MWVLEQLLCEAPPPPPPDVEGLPPAVDPTRSASSERMAQHRANPTCAGCHTLMDPIGFGMENFDAGGPLAREGG